MADTNRGGDDMEQIVEKFSARAADGRVVDIVKYVNVADDGPTVREPEDDATEGLPAFRTTDGRGVNHVAGNEYEILGAPEPLIVWRM